MFFLLVFQNQLPNKPGEISMPWESSNKHPTAATSGNPAPISGQIRDGFRILKAEFKLPPDSIFLKAEAKRALTICNLFTNHQLSLSQVAQLLEEDLGRVVQVLVQQSIIHDRRKKDVRRHLEVERRKQGLNISPR